MASLATPYLRWILPAVVTLLLGGLVTPADAQVSRELREFSSRNYSVHTTLTRDEARVFAKHMDQIYAEYQRRFANSGMRPRNNDPMPLYLFRTQFEYQNFLAEFGISGANTGGMFFVQSDVQGLATYVQGKTLTQVFAILQHEGFHQFAYRYFGPDLPIWVNEGLAQYFEDGVLVDQRLHLNSSNAARVASVKAALHGGYCIDFDRIVQINPNDWGRTLNSSPETASLLYDQSWSMVHFLITAEDGRLRRPFEQYLRLIGSGEAPMDAFAQAFGTRETDEFEEVWREFASQAQPDPLGVSRTRLEFLGQGLKFLHEHGAPMPRSMGQLRSTLRRINFRAISTQHGVERQVSAHDEDVYRYPVGGNKGRYFQMSRPTEDGLLPTLSAPGLEPQPSLVWSRTSDGELMMDIRYQ